MTKVEELEEQKAQCKKLVAYKNMVERLEKNSDFQHLIEEYYCTEQCARYAQQSVNQDLTKEVRESCLQNAQASGLLKDFLVRTKTIGSMAESQLDEIDDLIATYLGE